MDTPENIPQEKPPPAPMTPRQWWLLFAGGFLGWYLVYGVIWLLSAQDGVYYQGNIFLYACLWSVNIILIVAFAIHCDTRPVGLGILAALALNIVISLVIGLQGNAWCFVPFFIPQ